jgi:hypothetical protein
LERVKNILETMLNGYPLLSKHAGQSSNWIVQIKRWQVHVKKEAVLSILMNAATMSA